MQISIITINYNNCSGLKKTIESVVRQKNQAFEYIIVDGNSSDGSIDIINHYANHITKKIVEPDHGIYDAMNKGIKLAEGKYCLFLNSGDVLAHPKVIDMVLPYFASDKDFYTGIEQIKGKRRSNYVFPEEQVTLPYMWFANMRHQCTFIRTTMLKKRPYLTQYKIVADWEQNLYELYTNNATYEPINVWVDIFDNCGVSNQAGIGERLMAEKYDAFESVFGARMTRWLEKNNRPIWDAWWLDGLNALSRNNRIPQEVQQTLNSHLGYKPFKRHWELFKTMLSLLCKDLLRKPTKDNII